nr:type 2 isopentenyl-diphosphate Delta-isomerase [Paenibacillus ginsengihumi]
MRISRKMEHIRHALKLGQSGEQGMSDIAFVPNALPEAHLDGISLHTRIGELAMSSPILINAMTGGAPETEAINRELAVAARETGIAMAVGSQMAAIRNPDLAASYRVVRSVNPDGLVFGNLGGEATVDEAMRAVEMLRADALQIHLNAMQELIMPEGDRDFRGRLERIQAIAESLPVPVIVKEVGFGIARESVERLWRAGIRIVDVGGAGGTNFAAIENARREAPLAWLNDWGCKTSVALLEALDARSRLDRPERLTLIASGGMRSGLDVCKALALGASAAGMAGALLQALRSEGTAALIDKIREIHDEMRLVMTALGASSVSALQRTPLVVSGESAQWCEARGIPISAFAQRKG